jgi:hypothetical protein
LVEFLTDKKDTRKSSTFSTPFRFNQPCQQRQKKAKLKTFQQTNNKSKKETLYVKKE